MVLYIDMRYLYIKEAAKEIGVHPVTLKRWFTSGKVVDVAKDRNGWRIFSEEDIQRIKAYKDQIQPPDKNNKQVNLFNRRVEESSQ